MTSYTITTHGSSGSKARLRTALKLMGFDSIRIEEADVTATEPKPKPDNIPTSPTALAVAMLFGRKTATAWAEEEIIAFKKAVKTGLLTMENMDIVSRFYLRERKHEDHHCRTSVLTFCRHFGTELDKARAAKPSNGKALEWLPARNIVALPDPADEERIRLAAKEHAAKFREGIQ